MFKRLNSDLSARVEVIFHFYTTDVLLTLLNQSLLAAIKMFSNVKALWGVHGYSK
jgi:hypothetical protein